MTERDIEPPMDSPSWMQEGQMVSKHVRWENLIGKVVDAHAHVGINIGAFAETGFPYCSSIEDLFYRQSTNGVDCSVVFPITPELFFDIPHFVETGKLRTN
jgi:hypothetical protein